MENIKTLLLNLSTHNPQFTSVFKIGGIVKTFLEEYEALCASDSKDKDIFFNMKQLEVAYLEVFVGFENAFLAVNAVINLLAYHRRIKLPYLLVKGSVFGLNLFLAQSEADVFEHAQSQIIEYCKLIGLEELLLLCNPLRLNQVANKKPLIDHIRSSFQKTDDKAIKIMLKLIARFEMQDEPEVPALLNAAVQNNHIELCCETVQGHPKLTLFLLKQLKPSVHNVFMRRLIKENNLDPKDFPALLSYQRYGFFRFTIKEFGFSKCEERASFTKEDFEIFLEVLTDMKMYNEAYSVLKRSKFVLNTYLAQTLSNPYDFVYTENELERVDDFLPTSLSRNISTDRPFLRLSDIGYTESDVLFLTQENLKDHTDEILSAKQVGIDAEFYNEDCTNFSDHKMAILQIATDSRIYIIDCIELKISFNLHYFLHKLFKSDLVLKIGHSFHGDLDVMRSSFQLKILEVNNLTNIETLVDHKQKLGLAKLCEMFLGKSLCKQEQTSAWNKRPLRRAQLHYAALDAAVLLKLHEIVKEKEIKVSDLKINGEQKNHEEERKENENLGAKLSGDSD